jgi:hypothetical protein
MTRRVMAVTVPLLLALGGCSSKPPTAGGVQVSTTTAAPLLEPEASEIVALRNEAKVRHLHFRVWCQGDDDADDADTGFSAFAWPDSLDFDPNYVEEGGVPGWLADGVTQSQATIALLRALRHPPNWLPQHKSQKHKMKAECPPEIRG